MNEQGNLPGRAGVEHGYRGSGQVAEITQSQIHDRVAVGYGRPKLLHDARVSAAPAGTKPRKPGGALEGPDYRDHLDRAGQSCKLNEPGANKTPGSQDSDALHCLAPFLQCRRAAAVCSSADSQGCGRGAALA